MYTIKKYERTTSGLHLEETLLDVTIEDLKLSYPELDYDALHSVEYLPIGEGIEIDIDHYRTIVISEDG